MRTDAWVVQKHDIHTQYTMRNPRMKHAVKVDVFDARTTLVMLAANMFDDRRIDDARSDGQRTTLDMFDARRIDDARSDGQRQYVLRSRLCLYSER